MNTENQNTSSNEEETSTVEQEEQTQTANDGIEVHSVEDDAGVAEEPANDNDSNEAGEKEKEEAPKEDNPAPKRKPRARKRIKKLSEENRKLREELEKLKAQSTDDDRGNEQEQSTPPDIDDYDSFDEWEKAMGEYEASSQSNKDTEEPKQADSITDIDEQQVIDDYETLQDIFEDTNVEKKYADFKEVIQNEELYISPTLMNSLTRFEDSAGDLLYNLALDADEIAKVSDLEPLEQSRYLGKLEARIELGQAPKRKNAKKAKVSNAPDPIDPIDGGSKGVKSLDDDNLTFEEYEALLNKQQSKKQNDGWI